MLSALLLALALPSAIREDDPSIRVRLDDERYHRGDRARVWVETREDGYAVVLHADAEGRVRVLFPLDPTHDAFVRGGRKLELRGRSDREAFFVDVREGAGTVLAAYSATPFRFDAFVRGDHWDYRVLGGPQVRDDPEAALLEMVRQMAGDQRFEFDVTGYVVGGGTGRYYRYGGWSPYRYRFGIRFGGFYDPFFYGSYSYDPFFYGSYFYDPFCYDPWWGYDPLCYRSRYRFRTFSTIYYTSPVVRPGGFVRVPRFVTPREREKMKAIEPRRRTSVVESPSRTVTVREPRSVRRSGGQSSVRDRPSRATRPRATPSRGSSKSGKSTPPRRRR